jgi:hypothetical protein
LRRIAGYFVAARAETEFMNGDLYFGGFRRGANGLVSFGRITSTAQEVANATNDTLNGWIAETAEPIPPAAPSEVAA